MLANVQFFVSQLDKICKVSPKKWYITIFNCDDTLLEYAEQQYLVIEAPYGHASVSLPEGKYAAIGVWGYWVAPDGSYFGNHFTHKAIFQVCCNDHKCVWLYNPSIHECGIIYEQAVQDFKNNIDQTELDLNNDPDVEPTDARFEAINVARNAINTNLPALQALKAGIDNFAEVFGFAIPNGTGINRIELLNNTNQQDMVDLVAKNSEKAPEYVKVMAELNASIVK